MNKELLTCGDNSCHLDKPAGMGTNGGCRCFRDLPTVQRLRVQKYIYREKRKVQELEEEQQATIKIFEELNVEKNELQKALERYNKLLGKVINKEQLSACDLHDINYAVCLSKDNILADYIKSLPQAEGKEEVCGG